MQMLSSDDKTACNILYPVETRFSTYYYWGVFYFQKNYIHTTPPCMKRLLRLRNYITTMFPQFDSSVWNAEELGL